MHRFFVSPDSLQNDELVLRNAQAHQVRDVLHLRPGEVFAALDNSGAEYRVELINVTRHSVRGRVVEKITESREPQTRLILYQSLLKADKFEWVLQKGTELGIAAFVPVVSARAVADTVSRAKWTRWQRIATEAAEQSGRSKIPALGTLQKLGEALEAVRGKFALIPWEEERQRDLRSALEGVARGREIHLFIGPEGGFTGEEIEKVRANGVQPVSLGPRILRAETAGLVAASAIFFALGELNARN